MKASEGQLDFYQEYHPFTKFSRLQSCRHNDQKYCQIKEWHKKDISVNRLHGLHYPVTVRVQNISVTYPSARIIWHAYIFCLQVRFVRRTVVCLHSSVGCLYPRPLQKRRNLFRHRKPTVHVCLCEWVYWRQLRERLVKNKKILVLSLAWGFKYCTMKAALKRHHYILPTATKYTN